MVEDYQEKLRGKLFALLDSLICLVYKSDLSSLSKAQPVISALSAAPGLGIGVYENGFDHQLASVILGCSFLPAWSSSAALLTFC